MSKVIRWGVIGTGSVLEMKSGPAYQEQSRFTIHAVQNRTRIKADSYAQRHAVPVVHDTATDLIADPMVDAVYIATPPSSHCELALEVANAGKPCCVEKPMATSGAQARRMVAAFKERDLPLWVAYYRRSLPRFQKVKEWISQGQIGQIRHVDWQLFQPKKSIDEPATEIDWRVMPAISGGGYFVDLASHGLDLFQYLLGDIVDVAGVLANQQGIYEAEDAVAAVWRFAGEGVGCGALGSGVWNFSGTSSRDKVTLVGSEGRIEFSVFDDRSIVLDNHDGQQREFIENPVPIQRCHVENIYRHLCEGSVHPSTGETAARTEELIDVILQRNISE